MGFNIEIPNNSGSSKAYTGGAVPGPKADGAYPTPPNSTDGDRKNEGGAKGTAAGAFPTPPNAERHEPGRGGKL
jgi:hypothetical protein